VAFTPVKAGGETFSSDNQFVGPGKQISTSRNVMKHKLLTTLRPTALFLALASSAFASTTWYVNGVSGSDNNNCKSPTTACKTIGHAISLAISGDSIMVAAATYKENLAVAKSLNIIGSGASTTIIDGGGVAGVRVVTISSTTAHVSISRVTVQNGRALYGGGIYNTGTLFLNQSTVRGNGLGIVFGAGGGIYNSGALTIRKSTISANISHVGGGVENSYGTLWINNSTISQNVAIGACVIFLGKSEVCFTGYGGGISSGGTVTINNSTISGNAANGGDGGGAAAGGTMRINNSTISQNVATKLCMHVPPYSCFAGSGGGIVNISNASMTIQNSIVANSPSGGNCSGTMTSKGYNLSSDGSCDFDGPGDLNNTNPMLGPLQYNGGPTQTMALPSGSPAVDAGNPSGCTNSNGVLLKTDQRGFPRPDMEDTGGCDMGAYERQSD
jgi:hypothetical protein